MIAENYFKHDVVAKDGNSFDTGSTLEHFVERIAECYKRNSVATNDSRKLPRGKPRGPGPVEVVSAEFAGHVHDLTDEIQPRHLLRLHGL